MEARPWFRRWCCMTLLSSGHCPGWVAGAGPGWNYAVRRSTAESGQQQQQHLANLLIILTLVVTRSQVNTDPPSVKPSHSLSPLLSPSHHHTPARHRLLSIHRHCCSNVRPSAATIQLPSYFAMSQVTSFA